MGEPQSERELEWAWGTSSGLTPFTASGPPGFMAESSPGPATSREGPVSHCSVPCQGRAGVSGLRSKCLLKGTQTKGGLACKDTEATSGSQGQPRGVRTPTLGA